jgi:Gpi18-like mannosyltransferase/putative flippase GtrA
LFVALACAGLAARAPFLSYESGDYVRYVSPWYDTLRSSGVHAFGRPFSDYAPTYLYLLWGATAIPASKLLAIKGLSIAFDFAMAIACVRLARTGGASARLTPFVFLAVLLSPTVILNSSAWGQCDAIYTAALIAGLACFASGRQGWGALAFGVSIAVKAQAVFVLPVLLVLSLRRQTPWRSWLLLPLPYLLSIVLPVLEGRSVVHMLTIYQDQGEKYRQLTLSAPSLYAWLDVRQGFGEPGIVLGGAVILAAAVAAARWARLSRPADLVALSAFFLVLVPFVLPRMHERYFYPADVLTIVYALQRPSRAPVAVLVGGASLACYFPFLFGFEILPVAAAAGMMAGALVILAADVFAFDFVRYGPRLREALATPLTRFAAVGALSTGLFLVIYTGARELMGPFAANALSLGLSMCFNFIANRVFSFRERRSTLRLEVPGYLIAYLIGVLASSVLLWVALSIVPHPPRRIEEVIVLGAGVGATVTRYLLLTRFVYRAPKPRPAMQAATAPGSLPGA